jgi:mono/diheme cytochrome c family protein
MTIRSLRSRTVCGATLVVLFGGSCFEPKTPELRYSLNHTAIEQNADLAADENAQEHLRGALEMLFGTPQNPGFLVLEEWADEGIDPNNGGYDELSDEAFDEVKADNRRHFRQQLDAIAAGEFESVRKPLYADRLWARWQALLDSKPEDVDTPLEDSELSWRDEAAYLFEGFYPTLSESSEMYRQQCMHCHGTEGGGDGSTSEYLNPRPRDYRPGIFKFTALNNKARPRREDLLHILREGIYMTAMPSFRRFSLAELNGLVDYVRMLSMRGETEILLISDFEQSTGLRLNGVRDNYLFVWDRWQQSGEEVIAYEGEVPHPTPEAVARGRGLFLNAQGANCVQCHGVDGRGDGPSALERDEDGNLVRVKDDWGNEISPRDLTRGTYRFGRRPIDLYRRIYAGINGTPMPAHYGMQITEEDGTQRPLDENDVWDLVHFVRSLSSHGLEVAQHAPAEAAHEGEH